MKKVITTQIISKTIKNDSPNKLTKINKVINSKLNEINKAETDTTSTKDRMLLNGLNISKHSIINQNGLKEEFIKDLAYNMRQLALANVNENLTASAIDKISNKNLKIIELVSPKSHKLSEYEIAKLERKYKNIELIPYGHSTSSLPPIHNKKSDTIFIDALTFKLLNEFNDSLEQYNIQRKVEGYENSSEFLIKVGNKIRDDELRLQRMLEKPELKEFADNRSGFKARSLVQPKNFSNFSIARALDEYELMNGEMKLVKRRNVAITRALQDLVDKWAAGAKKT